LVFPLASCNYDNFSKCCCISQAHYSTFSPCLAALT
jgi:hypothetical protein